MAGALLDTLFSQSAVGLHVLDTELRVERVNALSEAVAPDRIVGLYFTDAYRLQDPEDAERLLRGVLESGVPAVNRVIRGQLRGRPVPTAA